jgi:hypothetical protein
MSRPCPELVGCRAGRLPSGGIAPRVERDPVRMCLCEFERCNRLMRSMRRMTTRSSIRALPTTRLLLHLYNHDSFHPLIRTDGSGGLWPFVGSSHLPDRGGDLSLPVCSFPLIFREPFHRPDDVLRSWTGRPYSKQGTISLVSQPATLYLLRFSQEFPVPIVLWNRTTPHCLFLVSFPPGLRAFLGWIGLGSGCVSSVLPSITLGL